MSVIEKMKLNATVSFDVFPSAVLGSGFTRVKVMAILDADKEGFLRSHRSLTQTIGRAARNLNGKAIMYADKITKSMQKTIDETEYRRTKQINYNTENNLVPMALNKKIESAFTKNPLVDYELGLTVDAAAEPKTAYMAKPEIEKLIREKRKSMEKAAKELDFLQAAKLRDDIKRLQGQLT